MIWLLIKWQYSVKLEWWRWRGSLQLRTALRTVMRIKSLSNYVFCNCISKTEDGLSKQVHRSSIIIDYNCFSRSIQFSHDSVITHEQKTVRLINPALKVSYKYRFKFLKTSLLTWEVQVAGSAAPPAVTSAAALAETPAAKSQFLRVSRRRSLRRGLLGVVLLGLLGPGAESPARVREIQDVPHGEARFCAGAKRHHTGVKEEPEGMESEGTSSRFVSAPVEPPQPVREERTAEGSGPWMPLKGSGARSCSGRPERI